MNPQEYNWLTDRAKEIFKEYFDEISENVADTLMKSSEYYDNVGDEPYVTGKLIEAINEYNKEHLNLSERLREATGLYINVKAWKNEKIPESKIGADLGIVLNVDGKDYQVQKVIIVQSKKGFYERGRISYRELIRKKKGRIKGVKQAKKMLKITPAAFFFLYNSSDILELDLYRLLLQDHFYKSKNIVSKELLENFLCNIEDLFHFSRINKEWRKYPFSFLPFPIFPSQYFQEKFWERKRKSYAGILVLPATKISSIKKNLDGTLETLLPSCINFTDFMVDFFLTCFVGDQRKRVIEKAGAHKEFVRAITRYTIEMSASLG